MLKIIFIFSDFILEKMCNSSYNNLCYNLEAVQYSGPLH